MSWRVLVAPSWIPEIGCYVVGHFDYKIAAIIFAWRWRRAHHVNVVVQHHSEWNVNAIIPKARLLP